MNCFWITAFACCPYCGCRHSFITCFACIHSRWKIFLECTHIDNTLRPHYDEIYKSSNDYVFLPFNLAHGKYSPPSMPTDMTGTRSLEFRSVPKPYAAWFMGYRPSAPIGLPRIMDEKWHRSLRFLAKWIFLHSGIHHRNFAELRSKAQGRVHMTAYLYALAVRLRYVNILFWALS